MHQGGEVVNTMLKLPHTTIGKSFFVSITVEGSVCISQQVFESAQFFWVRVL